MMNFTLWREGIVLVKAAPEDLGGQICADAPVSRTLDIVPHVNAVYWGQARGRFARHSLIAHDPFVLQQEE